MRRLLLLIGCLALFWPLGLHAAGILVQPSSLRVEVPVGQTREEKFTVQNLTDAPATFTVSADELPEVFQIPDNKFSLTGQERKTVNVRITPTAGGVSTTNLSIVAASSEPTTFNAAAGVKVPVTLVGLPKVKKYPWTLFALIAGVTVTLAGGLGYIYWGRRNPVQ
ncbi:MAG: hypothetical protein AAB515_00540 [Patescibacteria group bacterium]|mgnify:CR=1 FL=1